ncbi:phage tail sheath family protein [Burkholderia cenocepacia]|nr:phage tail sheath family protein [Burkholderia cenocepacia]
MSVQAGATAVPVLAFDSTDKLAGELSILNDVTRFDSWLDVTARVLKAAKTEANVDGRLYQSLRLYFLNGGGHCYVAPVTKLAELVPGHDDVTLLVQAGASFSNFKTEVNTLAKGQGGYFTICDGSEAELAAVSAVSGAMSGFDFTHPENVAVYYPWLRLISQKPPVSQVPPSGAVAGVYARVDRERGVWKAPANVGIVGATPEFKVTDEIDAACNAPTSGRSINVIRAFRGTGPLVWGARTLASSTDRWRYVPVRRLFNAVEKDIRTAMGIALFEPNSAPTWERVRSAAENYVHSLWQQGALLGRTPAQAYFVHIGRGITMTDDDIDHGRMVVKIGLAAVRPAEFIVLQLTQDVVPA